MKISGFSIARNIRKYNYPIREAVRAILPICDEFVINVGKSEDDTLDIVRSIGEPKIRIIETEWSLADKPDMLSAATNAALKECSGDWAFYVQADEIIHEEDLSKLRRMMQQSIDDPKVDAFRFRWLHFYGSYYRYRVDYGWFQKQDRIIRNNGGIESCTDAWKFRRKDGQPLGVKNTGCLLYHYGWVHPGDVMTQRRINAEAIYAPGLLKDEDRNKTHDYGDLNRFPPYFGSHPSVMKGFIDGHDLSRLDAREIARCYWWHPMRILNVRYKTGKRVKTRIE